MLTTYPNQSGINPLPLNWFGSDALSRGPIVASRLPSSLKLRNAIGAHAGSYSIYRALAIAIGELPPHHKPNLHNTEPVYVFPPVPAWSEADKIVSLDPYGHMIKENYADLLKQGIDIRPTIAVTRAHMRVPELENLVKDGTMKVDGKIVVSPAGEIMVTKGAVDPVWYLPGVAKRFGVEETLLRRTLL